MIPDYVVIAGAGQADFPISLCGAASSSPAVPRSKAWGLAGQGAPCTNTHKKNISEGKSQATATQRRSFTPTGVMLIISSCHLSSPPQPSSSPSPLSCSGFAVGLRRRPQKLPEQPVPELCWLLFALMLPTAACWCVEAAPRPSSLPSNPPCNHGEGHREIPALLRAGQEEEAATTKTSSYKS